MGIWSGGAAQDYSLLRVFECSAYFGVKDDKLNSRAKRFVFFGVKKNLKGYKLWDSENKKFMLSRYVAFDKSLLLKSFISQHVERMKTKDISQRVEVNATPSSPVGSVLVRISLNVTLNGDRVAGLNVGQVEGKDVELFAAKETKMNP